MADNVYEGMFLLDSNRFAADSNAVTSELTRILEKSGATVLAARPWQDTKLAYTIEGHRKGLYYLLYFRMDGTALPEVNLACKRSDVVLRQLILRLDPALVEPMLALATGEGGALSSFKEAPQDAAMT